MNNNLTVGEHLDALRRTLIRVCLILFLALICAFFFHSYILAWLLRPITLPLVTLSPLEGFAVTLKLSFWTAVIGSAPLWLYVVFRFILPALRRAEKRLLFVILLFSSVLTVGALSLAYNVTLPLALQFLARFQPHQSTPCWSLAKTSDLILWLYFGHAFAAILVVTLLLLAHYRLLQAHQLIRSRKAVIVLAFILGAILTPPDVFSQLLLACPLLICYELTILYAYLRSRALQRSCA